MDAVNKEMAHQFREDLSKQIQNDADSLILNYLYRRQNLVLQKFEEFKEKAHKSYDEQKETVEQIDAKVKGMIETQQNFIQSRINKDNRANPYELSATNGPKINKGFENVAKLSKGDLLEMYKIFEEGQIMEKYKDDIIIEIA